MSSSSGRTGNAPRSSSARTASRPFTMVSRSAAVRGPARQWDVARAPDEGLERARDARRHDGHARAQREQRDAGQPALEPAAHAERPLGEDPDHAAPGEPPERLAKPADVRPLEADGDRA